MSYESPIHVITDRMRMETEGEIIKAIQKVGVYVDKDELLKALAYDRDQYLKGYEDRDKELVRCKDCIMTRTYDSYSRGSWCIIHRNFMQDDYFCADGRREP